MAAVPSMLACASNHNYYLQSSLTNLADIESLVEAGAVKRFSAEDFLFSDSASVRKYTLACLAKLLSTPKGQVCMTGVITSRVQLPLSFCRCFSWSKALCLTSWHCCSIKCQQCAQLRRRASLRYRECTLVCKRCSHQTCRMLSFQCSLTRRTTICCCARRWRRH